MTVSPMTRMNAGRRTAHSRGGKKLCIWLEELKNGLKPVMSINKYTSPELSTDQ